ncbi:MAG: hypothetical protein A2V52_05935 [Actinobacteria bacterium RBG_19FT_COMBO_54_7]|uniref:DUF1122 domain-containing protein n=1 Tax=Candidatus Solincola sediminis TaxID=1797199 RepID=A0A1F2WNY1_9ACTN|nr:MAG: hypothetical protein A2Y75_10290 [Candidatus Solincola sediminis]OFW61844.1 MAG: hypothetical protein A2W01_11070 [Candidatus Solincola sediminis]OFW66357.1 MAG: hypothetical protein A2V52_05935 [Actinobacteria bacterium RBG_19FT_COMBO_54_7]
MIDRSFSKLEAMLQGAFLDGYQLRVEDLKRGRTDRERYFNLFLQREGLKSLSPVLQGLYSEGSASIKPWLEFRYSPCLDFPDEICVDLEKQEFGAILISGLRLLVGAGGSLMIIYGGEVHPLLVDSEKCLKRGFPPAATPLGFLLWKSGCRWFKDWYFSEGWREGAMKLQASYPLNDSILKRGESRLTNELLRFVMNVGQPDGASLEGEAMARAKHILASRAP